MIPARKRNHESGDGSGNTGDHSGTDQKAPVHRGKLLLYLRPYLTAKTPDFTAQDEFQLFQSGSQVVFRGEINLRLPDGLNDGHSLLFPEFRFLQVLDCFHCIEPGRMQSGCLREPEAGADF